MFQTGGLGFSGAGNSFDTFPLMEFVRLSCPPVPHTETGAPARLFWHEETGEGRNLFAVFRHRIGLGEGERVLGGWLHLFADGWYRVLINGRVLGYGPARFARRAPEFDTWRLGPADAEEALTIEVEVHSPGAPSYQAEPGGRAGLAAWGALETTRRVVDLSLPGEWMVQPDFSRDPDAEPFSFAQGPVEIRDLRVAPGEPVRPVSRIGGTPLGPVTPRSIPLASFQPVEPRRLVIAAPLCDNHFRAGFRAAPGVPSRARLLFFTHIHSPRAQRVEAGVFWGPLALNGARLQASKCRLRGNRENTVLELREGFNFFVGAPEVLAPCWPWMIELPAGLGLRLTAVPDGDPSHVFAIREPLDPAESSEFAEADWRPPASLRDIPGFPKGWKFAGAGSRVPSPAREIAWDIPASPLVAGAPVEWPLDVALSESGEGTVVFDFEGEYLGHAFFDVEGPEGVVVDVGYDERLTPRGDLDLYKTNPFTNTADRFILPGGRAVIETFHERGGRYLQLTIRGGPARIHRAGVRRTTLDFPVTGRFESSDPVFNWAWAAGVRTQQASMADGWIDPWRERGLYLGDAFVEAGATSKFTPDRRLEIWCLRLWANTQKPDGQMPDVTPSSHEHPLNDYTLLYVWWLREFWAWTGCLSLVREVWPSVEKIFSSPVWTEDETGLWTVTDAMRLFVDWGRASKAELAGANGVLNALRFQAHCCAAELAAALGKSGEAHRHQLAAARVRKIFQETLWDPAAGKFAAARIEGRLLESPALHANALALACGLPAGDQIPGALACLVDGMNFHPARVPDGTPELFFYRFVLEAFYRHGKVREAEELIRRVYGFLQTAGCWTLPETLARQHLGIGSMCHGWSASPMIFCSERILGVRPLVPGDTSRVLIAPESEALDRAEGVVPHPFGDIHVNWAVRGGDLHLDVSLPPGLAAQISPRKRLGKLRLVARVDERKERGPALNGAPGSRVPSPILRDTEPRAAVVPQTVCSEL